MNEKALESFLRESLGIEGIHRAPMKSEMEITMWFLDRAALNVQNVGALQEVYAPGKPLRERGGMDVRVGSYIPPRGGPEIRKALVEFCKKVSDLNMQEWWRAHCEFEMLHPFMDGNGRTGRTIWAWHMLRDDQDPFALSFLHRFYYQTLEHTKP